MMMLWSQSGLSKLGQLRCHNPLSGLWIKNASWTIPINALFFWWNGIMNVDLELIHSLKKWIFENFMKFYELTVEFSPWNPQILSFRGDVYDFEIMIPVLHYEKD